jgi:adenylosuccinate lyase
MIERYTRPEMAAIWTEENKFKAWLEVEILACEAWSELGHIPKEDVKLIRQMHLLILTASMKLN